MRTAYLKKLLWKSRETLALEQGNAMLIMKNKNGKRLTYEPLPGKNTKTILSEGILKLESLLLEREAEILAGIPDYRKLP